MALARIITRSHTSSQELALDLLARGYAVEIVSPDRIPDDIADLELRVDTGPGYHLFAAVEPRRGERSATLDFVHHMKAPMEDFIRRAPLPGEPESVPEVHVSHSEPGTQAAESPAQPPQLAVHTVSPAVEPRVPPSLPVPQPIAKPTLPRPTLVPPRPDSLVRRHPPGWFGQTALTFASVVLFALFVGFGIHRTGKAFSPRSASMPTERVAAASTEMSFLSLPPADPQPISKSPADSGPASKNSRVAPAASATPSPAPEISRRHPDDLIARNTVIYLDKSFEPPTAKLKHPNHSAKRNPRSRPHGGVIAANSVTYLDPSRPKPAKPRQSHQPSN